MGEKEELMEVLKTSIEMEEDGREFYIKAAKKSTVELTKRVFEALADDEIRHISAIKGYCETMTKKNATPQLCTVMPQHKDIKRRIIFGKSESELLKRVSPAADELEAYKIAMEMENNGYKFYKKTLDSIRDSNAKDLYKFLLSEEEEHFELISSTYEYLKNPAAWFTEEERPIVEGDY